MTAPNENATNAKDFRSVFAGKKCLITGGLGFIGSSLAIHLAGIGAKVVVVDSLIPEYGGNLFNVAPVHEHITINIADVRDEYSMDYLVRDRDYLFNLAGHTSHIDSMTDPYTDLDINCRAQLSILEACRKNNPGIKVVFASTRQIYGRPERLPVDENHPIKPVDVNGINKLAGEWYHTLYNNVYGVRSVSLRLTNTYGPRMRIKDARQTFLGVWIRELLADHPLKVFGDGSQLRDFNYVDDVCIAFLKAAASDTANGRAINLGSDEVINLRDLAAAMIELHGRGEFQAVPFPPERKIIDIGDYYGDWTLARDLLGWAPTIALKQGLVQTLEYFYRHGDKYA